MFSGIIVILVVLFLVSRQNNRIARLEKLIQDSMATKSSVAPQSPASQVPAYGAQSVSPGAASTATLTPQASIPTASPQAPAPSPKVRVEKDEESSGRFLGKLGIAAVLIGIAFFLKYAFDSNWIGEAGRVMIGIIAGIGFIGAGQFLRTKYLKYSDLLMGGGSAILYLSIFSAYSFYHLINASTAGVFMLCVTALTLAISVVNATQTLSLVGVIGAFATPFLVSSGSDDMLALFAYMTIVNIGVLGISFFKKWPRLNLVTFVGTGINFIVWYVSYYREDALVPTLGFVCLTFLVFLVANIARSIAAGVKADEADYLLLGGNASALAAMIYILLEPMHEGILGFAAVVVAIVYMAVAFAVNNRNAEDKALNIFLPGLAVTFLSLAVPMQFSGPWIAVAWFVEAAFLYGVASVISNRGFQVMGVVVYVLGLIDFLVWQFDQFIRPTVFVPIFNTAFMVLVLAVVVAYAIAYVYQRFGSITVEIQKRGIMAFVVIANILTIYALSTQIMFYHDAKIAQLSTDYQRQTTEAQRYNTGYDISSGTLQASQTYYAEVSKIRNQSNTFVSILWTLYAAALTGLGFARRISSLRRLGLMLFVITAVKVVIDVWSLGQLYRIISFIAFGLIALIASFAYAKYKDRLKDIV
ncbi:MAG: DUF2339 domain-containing protein [Candidatus Pacebacteria bacterium]|nr:DUF2339 domain-containing protein [Candidatus Paceibacterota bacterium]